MVPDHIDLPIYHKNVRDIIHIHLTLKFAGRIKKDCIIFAPSFAFNERFYLLFVLGFVNADRDNFYAGFVLPIGKNVMDSFQFAQTGLTPCCEE